MFRGLGVTFRHSITVNQFATLYSSQLTDDLEEIDL